MSTSEPVSRHVYGPVPSRRLGRSLGVDVIPFKVCSYDCVYCQLGRTTCKTVERREWVSLDAAEVASFRYANRPHPSISFELMLGGLVDFARSFRGRLWLEVLLLEGVTGIPEEVAAIARIARWIAPERVHLGTVTRPPAEPFAQAVPMAALRRFRSLFDPPAEVIADRPGAARKAVAPVGDERVLELLKRRPCTLHDLACGLGAPENEVVKALDRLTLGGTARHVRRSGGPFYRAVRDTEVRA